jgi:hypothetical protein
MSRNVWVLRQNYGEKTDQIKMRELNMNKRIITCPWGGWGNDRKNVIDKVYNDTILHKPVGRLSKGQDRRFVDIMKVGDRVLIAYAKQKTCVIAEITTDSENSLDTGLYWEDRGDFVELTETGKNPFCPVGRNIKILQTDFTPEFKPNRMSLTKMKNQAGIDYINSLVV